ncbi:alanine/glycine:cation symporter family protein [Sutterella megalosphaeroides]|uniref:Sodium:alanine symporter n=1 Tax=Sutterella megalosphaeroides TaxID=2494234 RepID=A0A2Z6IGG0_9BURK|nr:alanine/glycine:cation symporter family protein [Sutterella megalosphaeroides]BBF23826.1 sodium:alanine symporter [Sutterella megalosphaeroides]
MNWLNEIVTVINDFLWSYVLILMLVGSGLWFTARTGFVQLRRLGEMFRLIGEGAGAKPREGHISTFQAFCVSTASRVGVGNIAGIAIAVATGGPGAVFWMWVIATLGAATGFVESTLAQIYKAPKKGGGFVGGPAYYIGNVLGSPFFATVFAVLISVTYGLIFNSVQANTIAISMQTSLGLDPSMTGVAIALLTALVIFGGVTRIAKVVGILVPFMAGAYLLVAAIVTILNIQMVPTVLAEIVRHAFDFDAVLGAGFAMAVMTGVKRGLFSNEAGMGSIPNAAATADATHPVKQGLVQAAGVYVDTLFVCTASAMLVLLTPGWQESGLTGIELSQHVLSSQLGEWTNVFMTVIVLFFAFSSIIGNYFYGEVNMDFISRRPVALQIFRALVVCMVFFGSVASLGLVWNLADLFMALMAILNIVAILMLGRIAFLVLDDYFAQKRAGIAQPEFDPSILPSSRGVLAWPRHKDEEIDQA